MVRIRMKTIYAGPEGSCQPGQTMLVNETEAEELVNGNYAEYVIETPKADEVEEPADDETEAEDDGTAGDDQAFPGDIKVLKGGYFELPNGEKVRGKDKALAAYVALNQ